MTDRVTQFTALQAGLFDVLIIGGGIVGSGIARDAAMRGLRVCLVEQHDFAFGTSSRSSRLLHGGLRYLAQGRLRLVHEASVEKKIIHQIAPHLAEPLPFIFPTYADNKNWRLWELKIGVKIYDLLCGGRNLGKSSWLSRRETCGKLPCLRPQGLTGAVRYFDGFTNDARLVLDTLRSAAQHGATVLNYCRFQDATRTEHWKCRLTEMLSGKTGIVRASVVVNAAGPWADQLPHSRVKLRNAKGVHLVVDHARVPVPDTVVMTEGKRILFAIPWGERTILGTTDTDYCGSLEAVHADAQDIGYILQITNHFFPAAKLSANEVISSWAGVRPLVANPNGSPSDISRSHEITNPEPGWWDVAGGKLTTYRLMAEQTVTGIVKELLQTRGMQSEPQRCATATEPLLPAGDCAGTSGILPPKFARELVDYYCRREWAAHLEDVMVRRTGWHYYHRDAGAKAAMVAGWMGEIFGWPESVRHSELERYHAATRGVAAATA